MREIKFRAWDKINNVYIISSLDYALAALSLHYEKPEKTKVGEFTKEELKRFDLEQYTGLKDKTGHEIYEGDVYYSTYRAGGAGSIRGKQKERIKKVVIWDDRGRWHGKRIELGRGYGCCHPNCELGEGIEVIGNIHENPELL